MVEKGLSVKEAGPGTLIWREESGKVAIYSADSDIQKG